jgi:hypothetical protein
MAVKVGAGDGNGRIQSGAVGWGAMSDIHTIIDEYTATGSRLNVTARHGPFGSWLVDFVLRSSWSKQLDRCAAWLPAGHWNTSRWHPLDKRQVRPEVLARVEAWLRDRSVAREVQP